MLYRIYWLMVLCSCIESTVQLLLTAVASGLPVLFALNLLAVVALQLHRIYSTALLVYSITQHYSQCTALLVCMAIVHAQSPPIPTLQ